MTIEPALANISATTVQLASGTNSSVKSGANSSTNPNLNPTATILEIIALPPIAAPSKATDESSYRYLSAEGENNVTKQLKRRS
jgi:hypothetical protein